MLSISSNFQPTSLRLKELMDNLRYLNSLPIKSRVDIKQIGFVTPFSITPIAAIINEKKLTYSSKEHSWLAGLSKKSGEKSKSAHGRAT